jgi:hypothetical protein
MIASGSGDQIAGVSSPDEFYWVLKTAALLPRISNRAMILSFISRSKCGHRPEEDVR